MIRIKIFVNLCVCKMSWEWTDVQYFSSLVRHYNIKDLDKTTMLYMYIVIILSLTIQVLGSLVKSLSFQNVKRKRSRMTFNVHVVLLPNSLPLAESGTVSSRKICCDFGLFATKTFPNLSIRQSIHPCSFRKFFQINSINNRKVNKTPIFYCCRCTSNAGVCRHIGCQGFSHRERGHWLMKMLLPDWLNFRFWDFPEPLVTNIKKQNSYQI